MIGDGCSGGCGGFVMDSRVQFWAAMLLPVCLTEGKGDGGEYYYGVVGVPS